MYTFLGLRSHDNLLLQFNWWKDNTIVTSYLCKFLEHYTVFVYVTLFLVEDWVEL